jgi:hypothetical protein
MRPRTKSKSLAIGAVAGLIAWACAGQSVRTGKQQGRPMVEIKIELGQQHFISKESMVMRVLLHNTGSAAVTAPNPENNRNTQPLYTITGPSFPKGHTFHFRQIALGDPNPAKEQEAGMTVTIAPGETHEAALPLEQLVRFPQPGKHTLKASIEIGGQKVESAPIEFTIEAPHIRSMQFLADDGFQTSNPIRVLCLNGEAPNQRLYQAILREDRPDLGEVGLAKMIAVAPADPKTTALIGPWANHNRMESLLNRFGWQAGAVLDIEGLAGSPALRFTLPDSSGQLLRPALMSDSGDVDVMVLSAAGNSLSMIRFPPARPGAEAKMLWTLPLQTAPASARAAIGPRAAGARRYAVLILPEGSKGSRMILVDGGTDQTKPAVREAVLPDATPLPGGEPAIMVATDGTIHASAIFVEDVKQRKVFVADVKWPAGSGQATPTRGKSFKLPGAPRSAQVTYSVASKSPRREWLVLLQDGSVVFSGSPNRPRKVDGSPALPIDLVAMSQMTYLLTLDKQGLPRLELMH